MYISSEAHVMNYFLTASTKPRPTVSNKNNIENLTPEIAKWQKGLM